MDEVASLATSADTTKKLLVSYDPDKKEGRRSDFVVPIVQGDEVVFFGLHSKIVDTLGVMVFVGTEVGVSDLFAKLVDTGRVIPSVDQTVKTLTNYIAQLKEHKIGNVLAIERDPEKIGGFRLSKLSNTPWGATKAP
jgi:hypothetical protein